MPLPVAIMSGDTPSCSQANHFPVRPMPVMTSSEINSMSWRSQMSRKARRYPMGGVSAPPAAPTTGSTMMAATFSAPYSRMMRSHTMAPWPSASLPSSGKR